ncbi:MAG: Crp/Fnr family transcriptional regulator [Bacteroidota bacterium]
MDQLIGYFQAISAFSEAAQADLRPLFQEARLSSHQYFIEVSQYARDLAFLESGCVRAFFVNSEGKEYNKQFFVGPSLIGAYTSLLTNRPNRIAQQALTDCKIWKAPFEAVQALFAKHHDLERLGRKIAEYYFLEKEQKELEMALLEAKDRYQIFREQFPGLDQLIPQYHIASYLGISATQLSRIRKQMSLEKD